MRLGRSKHHVYGFLSFIKGIQDNLWITDHRDPDSPWNSAFCHINELADGLQPDELLNRDTILEFYLRESDQKDGGLVAQNVRRVQIKGR